jgi:hypothetical protein
MSYQWKVGDKAVCIADSKFKPRYGETFPRKGDILTVRSVLPTDPAFVNHSPVDLRFVEIRNKPQRYPTGVDEMSFNAYRFRPVVKTSIDIFTSMLAPAPKQKALT